MDPLHATIEDFAAEGTRRGQLPALPRDAS